MKYSVFALLLLFITNCGGTDTGNGSTPDNFQGGIDPNFTFADNITNISCLKLKDCGAQISESDCREGVFSQTNLDTEFGLSEGEYANFQAVHMAEKLGEIVSDLVPARICAFQLWNLSCDNPKIQNAYIPTAINPFEKLEEVFPDTCKEVYSD